MCRTTINYTYSNDQKNYTLSPLFSRWKYCFPCLKARTNTIPAYTDNTDQLWYSITGEPLVLKLCGKYRCVQIVQAYNTVY